MKIARAKAAWFEETGVRLDASYHLSEARSAQHAVESYGKCNSLGKVTERIFLGNRFRRTYVKDAQRGYPYLTASDMTKLEPVSGAYLSKVHTGKVTNLMLQKGWILVSCSGSIGRTVYTNEFFEGQVGTHDLIRIIPDNKKMLSGYLYSFLASKLGFALLTQGTYGGVIQHIEPHHIANLPVPLLSETEMQTIHEKIEQTARLREQAIRQLAEANELLMSSCELPALNVQDYEYFGANAANRSTSTFSVKKVGPASLAAWNYSQRVDKLRARIQKNVETVPLADCLEGNRFFSTGSFKRLEIDSPTSIELINQSDIFNNRIKGKQLARKYAGSQRLVEYGEILIAGVGTLGENETFCRALFAGEGLKGKLISGEFIRMNTNGTVPPGYLYAWLASEYGFRFIRSTQAGTKLCRPIPKLLAEIPVPLLSAEKMDEINQLVITAHTKRYEALQLENQAIHLVESAITG
jgi:type I restriction enzyme S subunit